MRRGEHHDPRRLEVERFAADGARLQGQWPLLGMARLVECCHPEALPAAEDGVDWAAQGERRRAGGALQTWLHLTLTTTLNLTCQRCLGPVATPLAIEPRFRFAADENAAAALDAEVEEDVLATTRSLDLLVLAEDELLLALPIVPRHERCPQPLPAASRADGLAKPSPFAVLAGFKPGRH